MIEQSGGGMSIIAIVTFWGWWSIVTTVTLSGLVAEVHSHHSYFWGLVRKSIVTTVTLSGLVVEVHSRHSYFLGLVGKFHSRYSYFFGVGSEC